MADEGLASIYREYDKDPAFRELRIGRNFVPGMGTRDPVLILVGEAPGAEEDAQSKPFVGKSGQVLDKLLRQALFVPPEDDPRKYVFVTNVIKYQPEKNRTPTTKEVDAARPYLRRELAVVGGKKSKNPHTGKMQRPVVCLLGKTAASLFGKKHGMVRGEIVHRKGWRYAYLYHPAVALYDPNMMPTLLEHFRKVGRRV